MISASNLLITNGTFTHQSSTHSRGFELLAQNVATQALHDSGHLSDPAKCHPDTRVAILNDLQEWADGLTYNYPIKWIRGSAGVGKTAIMRTTAGTLKSKKLLLASFFFWRTGERCNTSQFLIATLAYQIAITMPETRSYIERAVDENPHIFAQALEVQSQALIVDPITTVYKELSLPPTHPRVFVIDGLDECLVTQEQTQDVEKQCEILRALHWTVQQLPPHFTMLIASRPEYHIQTMFDTTLKEVSSSLALNDSPDTKSDITRFYVDKFREIQAHHPLRSVLSSPEWPSYKIIDKLVQNASGQFIYASTVIKFVGATKKNPSHQLDSVLDAEMRGDMRPFQALDVLYSTIFSAVEEMDLPTTKRVLGAILMSRHTGFDLPLMLWDYFLKLPEGEVQRTMLGLESVLLVKEADGESFQIYHASLRDFLFDSNRSGNFFIDKGVICEDLARQAVFHLCTAPIYNDDLTHFLWLCAHSWFREARPSIELHSFIEGAGMSARRQDLKLNYPLFLEVIKFSRLPDKDMLYRMKFDVYSSQMKRVVPLYLKDDSMIFLLLFCAFVGVGMRSYALEQFFDTVCPLSPELKRIDREEGLHLYRLPPETAKKPGIPRLRPTKFRDAVEEAVEAMEVPGEYYSKAASVLLKVFSVHSRYLLGKTALFRQGFGLLDVLATWISRASTRTDLVDCMTKYPITEDGSLTMAKRPIDTYFEMRKGGFESMRKSRAIETIDRVYRRRLEQFLFDFDLPPWEIFTAYPWVGIWAAWIELSVRLHEKQVWSNPYDLFPIEKMWECMQEIDE